MAIQTKLAEGITCQLCGRPIEGKIPVDPLPSGGFSFALRAAVAHKCRHCETFLCKECYTNEQGKLHGLRKLKGFDCPGCGSKFRGSQICVYPTDLDLDAVVAGPLAERLDRKRTQVTVQTERARGITCKCCGQPIEGNILVESLSSQEARKAFPSAVGFRCHYCTTFLCKACFVKMQGQLSGLKKAVGVDCPGCGLQFYSPYGSNLGIYPLDVNLNVFVDGTLEKFNKLLSDVRSFSARDAMDFQKRDLLDRIREQEERLGEHIRQKPEPKVLLTLAALGADSLLRREVMGDNAVRSIVDGSREEPGGSATFALVEIEVANKSGELIPDIINAYESIDLRKVEDVPAALAKAYVRTAIAYKLGRITWDERVVDCLIDTLGEDFWLPPKPPGWTEADLFLGLAWLAFRSFKPGPAAGAAESLLNIGNERGVAAIAPRLAEKVGKLRRVDEYEALIEWCVHYRKELAGHIVGILDHEDSDARLFAVRTLTKIGDPSVIGALSALETDPDRQVCNEARKAVEKLQR